MTSLDSPFEFLPNVIYNLREVSAANDTTLPPSLNDANTTLATIVGGSPSLPLWRVPFNQTDILLHFAMSGDSCTWYARRASYLHGRD